MIFIFTKKINEIECKYLNNEEFKEKDDYIKIDKKKTEIIKTNECSH